MKAVNPYLNFPGNTEQAFEFYRSVFGGEFLAVVRFRDFERGADEEAAAVGEEMKGFSVPDADRDKIAHIALPLGADHILMGTDSLESLGKPLAFGNNTYIALEADSPEEAEMLFDGLSAGGKVEMALQRTEWAEQYGSCVDRFGVQWMVSYCGDVQFGGRQD